MHILNTYQISPHSARTVTFVEMMHVAHNKYHMQKVTRNIVFIITHSFAWTGIWGNNLNMSQISRDRWDWTCHTEFILEDINNFMTQIILGPQTLLFVEFRQLICKINMFFFTPKYASEAIFTKYTPYLALMGVFGWPLTMIWRHHPVFCKGVYM